MDCPVEARSPAHAAAARACEHISELARTRSELYARELQSVAQLRHALELRDPTISGHLQRVPHYVRLVAQRIGLPPEEEDAIVAASTLHDLGRLALPDSILRHAGTLDDAQRETMRLHVEHGHAILRHCSSPLMRTAAAIALNHHEKWDGTGYPERRHGEDIPVSARIVAIADVFDALSSHRPQRCALALDFALEYVLRQRGQHFDPECVDAFMAEQDRVVAVRSRFPDPAAS